MAKYLAITGGVGGAKLALGLSKLLSAEEIFFAVNTGDDLEYSGLYIAPDIDTLTYTLAGINNPETGWGQANDTWSVMENLQLLEGDTWFKLGDQDLALNLRRTQLIKQGYSLSESTEKICAALKISHKIIPISNDPVRTLVQTDDGMLSFQDYFVRKGYQPEVRQIHFEGASTANLNPLIKQQLDEPSKLDGIIICPSNPYVSIDPLLSIQGAREILIQSKVPIVAVSPIVDGDAIKGPTAKIMKELGITPGASSIAQHYGELLSGFVLDHKDLEISNSIKTTTMTANTVMLTLDDKVALARKVISFLASLR